MLTRLFRHMSTIGHAFGVEGVELGIIEEIDRLDALTTADLDEFLRSLGIDIPAEEEDAQ